MSATVCNTVQIKRSSTGPQNNSNNKRIRAIDCACSIAIFVRYNLANIYYMSKQYAEMERLLWFLQMCLVRSERSLAWSTMHCGGTMEGGAARGDCNAGKREHLCLTVSQWQSSFLCITIDIDARRWISKKIIFTIWHTN